MTVPGIGQVSRVPRSLSVRTQRRFLRLSLHVHGVDSVICAAFRCGRSRCATLPFTVLSPSFNAYPCLSPPFTGAPPLRSQHTATTRAGCRPTGPHSSLTLISPIQQVKALPLACASTEGTAFGLCFY